MVRTFALAFLAVSLLPAATITHRYAGDLFANYAGISHFLDVSAFDDSLGTFQSATANLSIEGSGYIPNGMSMYGYNPPRDTELPWELQVTAMFDFDSVFLSKERRSGVAVWDEYGFAQTGRARFTYSGTVYQYPDYGGAPADQPRVITLHAGIPASFGPNENAWFAGSYTLDLMYNYAPVMSDVVDSPKPGTLAVTLCVLLGLALWRH